MYLVNEVVTNNQQDDEILRIVKEWLKGCSCSKNKPSDCKECTDAMIEVIERKILKNTEIESARDSNFDKKLKDEGEIIQDGEHVISNNNHAVSHKFKNGGYTKNGKDFSLMGVVSPAEHYYFRNGGCVPVNSIDDVLKIKEEDGKIKKRGLNHEV